MRSIRNGLALASVLSVLILAGCQKAPDNGTQAATGNDQKGWGHWLSGTQSHKVTIPEGTPIEVRLVDAVGSALDRTGQTFHATLDEPIVVNGSVAVPKGANVTGRVVEARPSGHLQTPAALALTLSSIEVGGKSYDLATSDQSWRGKSHKKRNAEWIGGAAGAGALIGALVGHGKGAAIGAGIGAGGGTATAYATGKKDITLAPETRLRFVLRQPATVTQG